MQNFDNYRESLTQKDVHLKDVLFEYCTGGDVTMKDVEAAFKDLKPDLKGVRKEALKALKKHESE